MADVCLSHENEWKKKSKQFPKSPANMRLCNCKFTARLNVWTFFSKLKYAFYWLNEMLHFSGPIKIYSHIFFGGKYARNRNAYCWCCFCCCKPKIVAKCNCAMYLRVSSPVSFHFISFHLQLLCCAAFYACVHLFRRDIESKFMFYAWNRSLSHFRFFIHFVQFLLLLKYATGGGCCCCSWFCWFVCSCCAQWSMYRSNFYIWVLLWQKHHYYHLWGPYASRSITTRKRHMNHIRFEPQNRRASARVECALGQHDRPFSLKFQLMDDLWDLQTQMLF